MSHQMVIDLSRDAILTALMIAAPMLLIALGVGLLVSIIQSVTQIQEQTLAFVPKLILIGVGDYWITNPPPLFHGGISDASTKKYRHYTFAGCGRYCELLGRTSRDT